MPIKSDAATATRRALDRHSNAKFSLAVLFSVLLCCSLLSYPAHYSDVMDLFRAVVASNELSPRTLLLSEAVIDVNSANYSAWHFRRLCLERLGSDVGAELEWVATVARDTPKNYQLWHHRRSLLELLADRSPPRALRELELTAEILQLDSKNYHAWSHRQWCLHFFARPSVREAQDSSADHAHADVFAAELVFIDTLLDQDVRNNSAWNQRFFVRTHARSSAEALGQPAAASSSTHASPMSGDVIHEELLYTGSKLLLAPHNESPWNYLEGLMRQKKFHASQRLALLALLANLPDYPPQLAALPEEATEQQLTERVALLPNRFAQSLLVELWESNNQHALAKAACERLANELDPIRVKYWEFRKQQIEARMPQA